MWLSAATGGRVRLVVANIRPSAGWGAWPGPGDRHRDSASRRIDTAACLCVTGAAVVGLSSFEDAPLCLILLSGDDLSFLATHMSAVMVTE